MTTKGSLYPGSSFTEEIIIIIIIIIIRAFVRRTMSASELNLRRHDHIVFGPIILDF